MVYKLEIADDWLALEKEYGLRPVLFGSMADVRSGKDDFTKAVIRSVMSLAPVAGADAIDVTQIQIPVAEGKVEIRALLYQPKRPADERRPVVVYIHGGGWSMGAPEGAHVSILRLIAKTGVVCVNIEYRLAPENPFPVPWQDSYDAYRWVIDNTDNLRTDNSKVFLAGNSAGANISAGIAAYEAENDRIKNIAGLILHVPMTFHPCARPGVQPPSYDLAETAPIQLVSMIYVFGAYYIGGNRQAAFDTRVSPMLATDKVLSQYPSTFISVCGADPLHDDGTEFAEKLTKLGVDVTLKDYHGYPHNWDAFPTLKSSETLHSDWGDFVNKVVASK